MVEEYINIAGIVGKTNSAKESLSKPELIPALFKIRCDNVWISP